MNRIHPKLRQNYEKWIGQIPETALHNGVHGITVDRILSAHYLLCDYFLNEGERIASPGPRDLNLLLSAFDRQTVGFEGISKWNDPYHIAATLFYGIIKNHPFYDGNKRTALLAAIYQLGMQRRLINVPKVEFEQLAVRTAGNNLGHYAQFTDFKRKGDAEVRTIAHFFRTKTRKEDKALYVITFRELAVTLRRFGFEVEGPNDNCIDIVRYETPKASLLNWKPKPKRVLIIQVGCPRMTAQVNQAALRSILRATKLTAENGYDSEVFFKEADPLHSLIDEFREPLRRLKDK